MVLALPTIVVSLRDNSLITVVFEVVFGDPSPWFYEGYSDFSSKYQNADLVSIFL